MRREGVIVGQETPAERAKEIMELMKEGDARPSKPIIRSYGVTVEADSLRVDRQSELKDLDAKIAEVRDKIARIQEADAQKAGAGRGQSAAAGGYTPRSSESFQDSLSPEPSGYRPSGQNIDAQQSRDEKSTSEEVSGKITALGSKTKELFKGKSNRQRALGVLAVGVTFTTLATGLAINNRNNLALGERPNESLFVSGEGILRFSGETGIAAVVNTTDGKLEVVPSDQLDGLRAEIDSYARMGAHVSPENFSKFASVEDTDDPGVKKVVIDRSAMAIGLDMPKPSDESEEGLSDAFYTKFFDSQTVGERLVDSDKVIPEDEELIRSAVVKNGDEVSPKNKSYYAASRIATVGSILGTEVCKDALADMYESYDEIIKEAYENLGKKKGVKYEKIEFKGSYTSGADMLVKVSRGEELDPTFRGEAPSRAACDIKKKPKLTSEYETLFTGVPSDGK